MTSIKQNLTNVINQVHEFEKKCGRAINDVQVLAVSKTKPIEALESALDAGQRAFGENYVQEGVEKVHFFNQQHSNREITWHFIGPIQSNKTKLIAENFDWVHTIERTKIAQRLNNQRPENSPPMQVLIQVNISGEERKSGATEDQIFALAQTISEMPNLQLRGLMAIPENVSDYQQQLVSFVALSKLQNRLQQQFKNIDTLSMGMSGDMEAAIEAGSTMIRIGTAIFGARDYSKQ
ncbi:MAG: YggS family pyridoxal phosphate-dependent enzyme [Aliivibrio sp.]|uniref:YggS family pyridoxal phosphate-dependent enzyme n=1 Tax=Aliivibrio sp. TaxID=1872443 RepID=UPI001A601F73|nr:YggS family pyridoxal phosphate-dependent enzyme [Aliivibrio sp.]